MSRLAIAAALTAILTTSAMAAELPEPPCAAQKPHTHTEHGVRREDSYYWLRDRENAEVIDYLKAENAYTKAVMADTEPLQRTLFEEIKGRIKQDDDSYPVRWKSYVYYTRYEQGAEYPLYCRKLADEVDAAEQITLNVPELAKDEEYCDLDEGDVSPDERLLVYTVDLDGRRIYSLHIKDLETGEVLPDLMADVDGGHAWAADSKTLFYTKQDPETLRSFQVWRHVLGTPVADDVLVYEEPDETFDCYVSASKSERFIEIGCSQTVSDEVRLIPADDPTAEPVMFAPRRRDLEYEIEHYRDGFYVLTNKDAENFRLMWAADGATSEAEWKEVIAHRSDVFLVDFEIFDGFIVTEEREEGLNRLRIRPMSAPEQATTVDFGELAYSAWTDTNLEFNSEWLRYGFSSLKTPSSLFEVNLRTGEKRLLKQQPVLGGYNSNKYTTERLFVEARDGTRVPVSIVYRTDMFKKDGESPLLLYAYGSYGSSTHASFGSGRLSLIDRGFVYAIAHVRGGQEMGRAWYEDGKLLKKKNTFTDFIDCADHLVKAGYTSSAKLCANGGSAGGLLMGAIVNARPELFAAVVADVPFVDVVTTMLDESIPLTTGEYDEWGNPEKKEFFDYMLSYSPYDQVREVAYPAMLVVAGLHDSQVQYWEPAKWVARLRERGTGDELLILKTDMEAGHGGASGRFQKYKEAALEQAFLLKAVEL